MTNLEKLQEIFPDFGTLSVNNIYPCDFDKTLREKRCSDCLKCREEWYSEEWEGTKMNGEGNEMNKDEKWHDLRKDRNDLPEIGKKIIFGSEFCWWNGLMYNWETVSEATLKYMADNPEIVICWKYFDEFEEPKGE